MVEKYKALIEQDTLTEEEAEKARQETIDWVNDVMKEVKGDEDNLPHILREQAF